MRRIAHLISTAGAVLFFAAIPIGMAAEKHEIVVLPDRWELACFGYFWILVAIHCKSRPTASDTVVQGESGEQQCEKDPADGPLPRHPPCPNRMSIWGMPADMFVSTMPMMVMIVIVVLVALLLPVVQFVREWLR